MTVIKDFVFGSLSTEALRHKNSLALRKGLICRPWGRPRDPSPGEKIRVEMSAGPYFVGEKAWLYWTNDGSEPTGRKGIAENGAVEEMVCGKTNWDTELWGYIRHFSAMIPGQAEDTIIRYRTSLQGPGTEEVFADERQTSAIYVANDPTPDWTRDAIIYHVFVDRFHPGKGKDWKKPQTLGGFYGGTLGGVIEKLDYIQDIGFNTIWLSPIFPSPSHHGYDATDLFSIEPRLGSLDEFRELIRDAHHKGIRILLDLVPNHISNEHPIFQEAIRDPSSQYVDWFTFEEWPDKYTCFFGVKSLPQLNLHHPEARKYMVDAAVYWLKEGVDGFRVDYAIGPAQEFWADFRRETRRSNPECWTFGEVIDPPDVQLGFEGLLDGCLDFMLLEAIRETFAFHTWTVSQFASFLERHEAFFPEGFSRPSFLDNHDMNRFLWAVEGDRRKLMLSALCQFTLAGAPIVYYGTEVGLSQERDVRQGERGIPEEARLPMLWGDEQDEDLLRFYQKLIKLRIANNCLRIGNRQTIYQDEQILVYSREVDGGEKILVILNIGGKKRTYQLNHPWRNVLLKTGGVEEHVRPEGNIVDLEGWSGLIVGNINPS